MNIWHWMEKLQQDLAHAGQTHSAQLIDDFSSEVCDLQVERAEALLPEAKALAHTLENPWLEVFIGHWEMRNRLGNKGEGESALADAVALFERAHRSDTHECPQSVCITQDLSACYANIDGPGWAAERIEVCDETLARITPKWGCFQCISIEKSEALLDLGQAQAAYDYLEQQTRAIEAAGEEINAGITEFRNKLLLALGRYQEALEHIASEEAKADGAPEWANIKQPRDILKARALAALGRDDEALEALPALRDIHPGTLHRWLNAIFPVLQRRPELNNWSLGSHLQHGLDTLARHGAHRHLLDMAAQCIELALTRGALWTARRQMAQARQAHSKLRVDAGAAAKLDALQARMEAQAAMPLPTAPENLLQWLDAQDADSARNPEAEVEWLLAALAQRPDDLALLKQSVEALAAIGAPTEAIDLLWRNVRQNTDGEYLPAYFLLDLLLATGRSEEVEPLAELYQSGAPDTACWMRAQLAKHNRDWTGCEQHCRKLLALAQPPMSHGAKRLLAHSLMQQQRFADAAATYAELIQDLPEDGAAHWDYLTAASAAQDWQGVRRMAAAMDMALPEGDGAPQMQLGWVLIRSIENGEPIDYYAMRSGPTDARIMENAPPRFPQRSGDHVAFDAQPLFPPPEDDEAKQYFVPTFMAVHTLQPGGRARSIIVEGPDPGDEAIEALRQTLQAQNTQLWVHRRDGYQLHDQETGEALPGILFTVAPPQGTPAAEIDRQLRQATAHWPKPVCWLALAEEAGANPAPHQAVIDRYGL
ncbi:hypothetical protein CO611_03770 [Lysobacteraceae bacterium NML03-0222]|nr:hypothetical protein CO611_03770 [Xanthomonadaceae bacterium NML03-0222]